MTTLLSIIITINIKLSTPSSFLHLIINSPPLSASMILICVKYFWGQEVFLQKKSPSPSHQQLFSSFSFHNPCPPPNILFLPRLISCIFWSGNLIGGQSWTSERVAKHCLNIGRVTLPILLTLISTDLLEMFETVWVPVAAGPQLQECGFSPLLVEH